MSAKTAMAALLHHASALYAPPKRATLPRIERLERQVQWLWWAIVALGAAGSLTNLTIYLYLLR